MTRKNLLAMAVLFAITGAGVAMAADKKADADKPAAPPRGAQLDANGDGFIDKAEAAKAPRLAERFDELDKNKDGKLAKDELPFGKGRGEHRKGPRHPGPNAEHGFAGKLDADKDGRISREEAKAEPKFAERFDQADVNKDGFIDKADFELRIKQQRDAWFTKADTDKDGKLSRAEFDAAQPPRGAGPRSPHGKREGHGPLPPPPAAAKEASKP